MKRNGRPRASASMWILVVSPPRERPRAWSAPPFAPFPVAACWWARTRVVSSIRYWFLRIVGEHREHPFPYAGLGPACEALVDGLPLAVSLGQVVPVCAGAQDPENAVDEQAVVLARSGRDRSLLPGSMPAIRPHCWASAFISLRPCACSESVDPDRNESALNRDGNPECRLDLAAGERAQEGALTTPIPRPQVRISEGDSEQPEIRLRYGVCA